MAMQVNERVQEFLDLEQWFIDNDVFDIMVGASESEEGFKPVKEIVEKLNRYIAIGESMTPAEQGELDAWADYEEPREGDEPEEDKDEPDTE